MATAARALPAAVLAAALIGLTGCGSAATPAPATPSVTVALDVPASADAYVAAVIEHGAQLAADEANQKGFAVAGRRYRVLLRTYDDAGQPQRSAANVDSAIHDGAVAVVEDGLGAAVSAPRSQAAGVPEIVIDNGDAGLMDPQQRPSLYRLGIANDAAAGVLATYVAARAKHVAILHDDTESGRDGATQLATSLATAGATAAVSIEVSADNSTFDAQMREVASSGAGALALWGTDTFTGRAVAAARSAGLGIPLFGGPETESPAVRVVAGAASDGVRFVSARMTSENDAASFGQFEHRLAAATGGPTDAGVKDAQGQEIRQPNDREVFSYDAVNLVLAALRRSGSTAPGAGLLRAIASVTVTSANGDTRGFNPQNHEGVSDDDMYVAVIHDMQFEPVRDEQLSASLPAEDEILSHFGG